MEDIMSQMNKLDQRQQLMVVMLKLMVEHDVVSWDELEKRNDYKREKLKKWSDLIE